MSFTLLGILNAQAATSDVSIGAFTERTTPATGEHRAAVFGDGLYLFAGGFFPPFLITSTDAISWTLRSLPSSPDQLIGLGFGNGVYLVTGDGGYLARSTDGTTWTQQTTPGSLTLRDATFGNSLYVVVGNDGYIATSPNGTTWTQRSAPNSSSIQFNTVIYDGTQFVIGGDDGYIATSSDGTTWTEEAVVGTVDVNALSFGNDIYVAAGEAFNTARIFTSTDLITWTLAFSNVGGPQHDVIFGDGLFAVVGNDNNVRTTQDGVEFIETTVPNFSDGELDSVAYGDGIFVVGGRDYIATAPIES